MHVAFSTQSENLYFFYFKKATKQGAVYIIIQLKRKYFISMLGVYIKRERIANDRLDLDLTI